MKVFIYIFIDFIITLFILFSLEKLSSRFNVLDFAEVDTRKIHTEHIPILGGVGIFFGLFIGMIISGYFDKTLGAIVAGSLLVIIGLIDDSFDLSPIIKLIFQLITAALLLLVTDLVPELFPIPALNWIFGILFITAIINASNMNDGFDGQLSMMALIFLSFTAFILKFPFFSYFIVPILVFLFFNLPKARMFLGDAGSMLIGVIVAYSGLLLMAYEGFWKGMFIFCIAYYIPLFDLAFAVIRRSLKKKSIFSADKGHLHHIFLEKYPDTTKVLWIFSLAAILLAGIGFLSSFINNQWIFLIFNLIILAFTVIIIVSILKKGLFKEVK
ncbi:undecaprenyl/decaprenyl-phosphate alpha-N-acetylglucosaminyl 1-phosphate transferase [Candidatus Dependentiae bacterium]|nr:undecaprenyl/decaprenyl-phosphate alpha-N-acetylglucosaminyl 1-phosphate transferase [Candidatus Dependentiae bacterium]